MQHDTMTLVFADQSGPALAPGERIGFEPERDAERFTVTPKGVVVVPAGYPGALWRETASTGRNRAADAVHA